LLLFGLSLVLGLNTVFDDFEENSGLLEELLVHNVDALELHLGVVFVCFLRPKLT